MGFADSLLNSYAAGYQQKLQASRAKEDADRQVRIEMARSHAQAIEADDTLTDEERRSKLRDIFNTVGEDTGYKHDPKIFGLFHPQSPGHRGTAMGDAVFGPALPAGAGPAAAIQGAGAAAPARGLQPPPQTLQTPPQSQSQSQISQDPDSVAAQRPQPYAVVGTPAHAGMPAVAGPTPFADAIPRVGRQVMLQPPPSSPSPVPSLPPSPASVDAPGAAAPAPSAGASSAAAPSQPGMAQPTRLQPPPSDKTMYPPGYEPDTSSKAGRREAAQVRSWWVEHQGQVDLMKQEALDKGYTEKASIAFDPDKNETVTTFVRPADGAKMEVRAQGVPPNVQAAYARINAQNERKVNQEVAILRRLPENAGKSPEEIEQQAAQNLASRQDVVDKIKAGTLKWQGGDLTKLIEAHKTLSDPNASEDEKAGARGYIEFRNAALEANKARAQYFSTAGDREEMREATQALGAVNRVRPLFVKADSDAKALEEQASAKDSEAEALSARGTYKDDAG